MFINNSIFNILIIGIGYGLLFPFPYVIYTPVIFYWNYIANFRLIRARFEVNLISLQPKNFMNQGTQNVQGSIKKLFTKTLTSIFTAIVNNKRPSTYQKLRKMKLKNLKDIH